MRNGTPKFLALFAVVFAACVGDDGIGLTRWQLDGEVALGPRAVQLPGHLPVADRAGTYTLTTSVALPEVWRGQTLTVWISDLPAMAEVRFDQVISARTAGEAAGAYRAHGPLSWSVPAEATRDGDLAISITVQHRWTQSGWWASAPRLVRAGERPRSSTLVLWINTYLAIAALISLLQLGLTSLAIYLVDRTRHAYLWFAIQVLSASCYPMHVLGLPQRWLGVYDTPVLAAAVVTAITASIYFTHAFFELAPPWRGWSRLWAVTMLAFVALAGPFTTTPISGPITVAIMGALSVYQLVVCGRLAVRHPDRLTARFQFASWVMLSALFPPDLVHWMGLPSMLDGARPASIGLFGFALCLSLLLARRHILSLRAETDHRRSIEDQRGELLRLNEDLRRDVQERSSQLFAALASASAAKRPGLELKPGDVIAQRYRVVRALGRGGMGTVHEVERLTDGKRFALKVTHDVHGAAMTRLAREAMIASRLTHRNLVRLTDVSVSDAGVLFLVMELVDGDPLGKDKRSWGNLEWALPVLAQIADGLVALHAAGVVHRDLKPANVLITPGAHGAEIKITDFGVSRPTAWFDTDVGSDERRAAAAAQAAGIQHEAGEVPATGDSVPAAPVSTRTTTTMLVDLDTGGQVGAIALEARMLDVDATGSMHESPPRSPMLDGVVTRTGHLVGTPPYIPPEMAEPGYAPEPSADVFAFGVIAFELCSGSRPFERPPVIARLAGAAPEAPASLATRSPAAPPALISLIDRCVSIDPARRPTADEIASGLRAVLANSVPRAPEPGAGVSLRSQG